MVIKHILYYVFIFAPAHTQTHNTKQQTRPPSQPPSHPPRIHFMDISPGRIVWSARTKSGTCRRHPHLQAYSCRVGAGPRGMHSGEIDWVGLWYQLVLGAAPPHPAPHSPKPLRKPGGGGNFFPMDGKLFRSEAKMKKMFKMTEMADFFCQPNWVWAFFIARSQVPGSWPVGPPLTRHQLGERGCHRLSFS